MDKKKEGIQRFREKERNASSHIDHFSYVQMSFHGSHPIRILFRLQADIVLYLLTHTGVV